MFVTWVTQNPTAPSWVEFGRTADRRGKLRLAHPADSNPFTDQGGANRTIHVHRATLLNLKPGAEYQYRVGSSDGWSNLFFFTAMGDTPSPTFAVYGDFGLANARTLGQLQRETQEGRYDMILHVGDFAYDLHRLNGTVGDQWMRQIESIAAYVPYMTAPGNHEWAYHFAHYRARFTMPQYREHLNDYYRLQGKCGCLGAFT